jgi:hypothetical protein
MPKMRMRNMRLSGDAGQEAKNLPVDMDMEDVSGRNATQRITYDGVEMERLAADLKILADRIRATHPNAVSEARLISQAQQHAEAGDGKSAKELLRGVGKWVSKLAVDAGAEIAAKFIANAITG